MVQTLFPQEKSFKEKFYKGLEDIVSYEEFKKAKNRVDERAFSDIILGTKDGSIKWKRDLNALPEIIYTAETFISNASREGIKVPLIFSFHDGRDGCYCFLYLSKKEEGVFCDTNNTTLKELAEDYFELPKVWYPKKG